MPKTTYKPSDARKNFYQLLKDVNNDHSEIEIISKRNDNNAVLLSLVDWNPIQETLTLEQTEVLDQVRKREKDNTGFIDIDEIDWDNLM